ncbi:MAG: Rieske 2Fe-2S domain-containing protein [Pyrinomonadaceae bacterium]
MVHRSSNGVLNGNRIVCPWHHACFDAITGHLEEPLALDSLPCYDIKSKVIKLLSECLRTPGPQ